MTADARTEAVREAPEQAVRTGDERGRLKRATVWCAGMARYLTARTMVGFTDFMPRPAVVRAFSGFAFLETALTSRGRSAQAEARIVMGQTRREAFATAWKWISMPYLDLVDLRRVSRGREDLSRWSVEEVNSSPAFALADARQPMLAVGGHFSFGALLPLALRFPEIVGIGVVDPLEPFRLQGDVLLRRLMMGMVHQLGEVLMPGRTGKSYVGQNDVQTDLANTLSQPGGVAFIMIDIDWKRAWAFHRPFCGYGDRGFALGAARIARIAQVPVVMVTAERLGDRRSRARFSDPMYPGPSDDASQDRPFMSHLLDMLELEIGRRRHAYPHPIGWQRRWSAANDRWE
jgi:hypothetical protein